MCLPTVSEDLIFFHRQTRFRQAFYKENIITAIVRRLQTENEELQGYCANAIFKVIKSSPIMIDSQIVLLIIFGSHRHTKVIK